MICKKCYGDFSEIKAEKNKTYTGIDYHHNPPTFMFFEGELFIGDIIPLCRKCHRELHDIILKIMFRYSNLFKFKKSEYQNWIGIIGDKKEKCRIEVYNFTREWLNETITRA